MYSLADFTFVAGMLQLLAAKVGHHTDVAMRGKEEMAMVIKEAAAARDTLKEQVSRIANRIQVQSCEVETFLSVYYLVR